MIGVMLKLGETDNGKSKENDAPYRAEAVLNRSVRAAAARVIRMKTESKVISFGSLLTHGYRIDWMVVQNEQRLS